MRSTFTLLFLAIAFSAFSQATFNSPESVEYDAANHRWLVANTDDGEIVSYYPQSNLTVPFASGMTGGPYGIEILGSTVYACDGGRIKGFDLATGVQNFNLNLGATFLNGITTDGSTYLFVTDFSAKKIYRINPAANAYNLMTTTVKTPNGIIYDGANNRCVFVTWGSNAPVQAMSLADSTISTVRTTTLSNIDGITRDNAGYWYISVWGTNGLYQIDPGFTTSPVSVMSGLTSPADMDINTAGDSIAIPNTGSANNVVFYTNINTGVAAVQTSFTQLFPNPAAETVCVWFPGYTEAQVTLFDAAGKAVLRRPFGGEQLLLDVSELPSGMYILEVRHNDGTLVERKELVVAHP